MRNDPQAIKEWLANLGKDRAWLAERIGVSKRTLDNWFSDGFPRYACHSITMIDQLEGIRPIAEEDALALSPRLSRILFERAEKAGFGSDYMAYANALLRHALELPPPALRRE